MLKILYLDFYCHDVKIYYNEASQQGDIEPPSRPSPGPPRPPTGSVRLPRSPRPPATFPASPRSPTSRLLKPPEVNDPEEKTNYYFKIFLNS